MPTTTTGIVVDIGSPALTGVYANDLVSTEFSGVTYPIWLIVTNHLDVNVSLPEVDGLFLRPISQTSANYALVEVANADQLLQLAASIEQIAISHNSRLAISLNELPNYGHPVATPTNLNIVPPSMPEPSSHIVPIKTVNGVSIIGYGDVALDIETGAKIDDAAGPGALTVVWSAHKIDEAIKTHTHSNYALKSHTHTEYADVAHTHTGFASATHDHAADYAPLNHAHASYSLATHNHDTQYSVLGHTHTGFAPLVHTHTGYASDTHDHDTKYAGLTHTHTGYAADTHTHSNYSLTTHNHTGDYAGINHTHSNYALTSHDHNTLYAAISHTHTIAIADVTGLSAALASVTPASGTTVSTTSTATLTNKTISMASNSLTGTIAEFNTALTDADFATLAGTETLTNKTLEAVNLTKGYTESVFEVTGATPALSPANGSIQTWVLTTNKAPTIGAWADGQSILLGVTAGSYTVTWPTVTWSKVGGSGTAPSLTATGINWVVLWKVGGTIFGSFLRDA